MTTLAAAKPRAYEQGALNNFTLAASTRIYEGAAVGVVKASGLARPLQAGDRFVGFATQTVDSTSGVDFRYYNTTVEVWQEGYVELSVSGAVITDAGLPVYATDDDTFTFSPVASSFIGFVKRFSSAGVAVVEFDSVSFQDPYAGWTHSLKSANYTVDATDTGKFIWVDTDAVVITLPAVEGINMVRVGNLGAYGTVGVSVSPNAADMIEGPGITAADDKDLINTKATAQRHDWIEIMQGDANGWSARFKGTWARQA
ncbi:hypothetical protein HL667_00015 [Bradyrhizobium sp. 83012]|uniref:Uncharacterized protein n=1 Tax=Bradyrhizobium aeschynomenes TaxID=2734909 RepID=A0ABX2C4Z8_9BRAD|nr:hypothetical protein [Bradyrhizobium aeschynomenes]NPU63381.1 hypothetical protein [Bradyrhizobium aeschynomenes]